MLIPKVRVTLESFHYNSLKEACLKIKKLLEKISNKNNGIKIITLPTQKRIYCVLKSPHVNKNSREHFESRRHKRIIEIYSANKPNKEIVDLFLKTNLLPTIYYQVKIRK